MISNIEKNIENFEFEPEISIIPDYAFSSCYNLKEINIPDTVTSIGRGAFQNCKSLKKVKLPANITEIPNNLFLNCINLKEVSIPNSVLRIGDEAFFGIKAEKIKIPKSVVTIGKGAFTGVTNFEIYDSFNYGVNKYNIFTWLSEQIYDRESDGKIPDTYTFIKNVVISVFDDETNEVKFRFFIPFNDKFDIFTISHEVFINNRLDLALLDKEFQRIRDFENKTNYVFYRITYPYKLSDENIDMFTRFINANDIKIAERFIDDNTVEPLIRFEKLKLINDNNIDKLIEYANINRRFNSLSYLMNYKNENFKNRYSL